MSLQCVTGHPQNFCFTFEPMLRRTVNRNDVPSIDVNMHYTALDWFLPRSMFFVANSVLIFNSLECLYGESVATLSHEDS